MRCTTVGDACDLPGGLTGTCTGAPLGSSTGSVCLGRLDMCAGKADTDPCGPNDVGVCANGDCALMGCTGGAGAACQYMQATGTCASKAGLSYCKPDVTGCDNMARGDACTVLSAAGTCEPLAIVGTLVCKVSVSSVVMPCDGKADMETCNIVPGIDSTAGKCVTVNGKSKCSLCGGKADNDACSVVSSSLATFLSKGLPSGFSVPTGKCMAGSCKLDTSKLQDLVCDAVEELEAGVVAACGFKLSDHLDWFDDMGKTVEAKITAIKGAVNAACSCALKALSNGWKNQCPMGMASKEYVRAKALTGQKDCTRDKADITRLLSKLKYVCPKPFVFDSKEMDCDLPMPDLGGLCPSFLKVDGDSCGFPDVCIPPFKSVGGKCTLRPIRLNARAGMCIQGVTGDACQDDDDSMCSGVMKCCAGICVNPLNLLTKANIKIDFPELKNLGTRRCDLLRVAGAIAGGELAGIDVEDLLDDTCKPKKIGKLLVRNGKKLSLGRPHPCKNTVKKLCKGKKGPEQILCLLEKKASINGLCQLWINTNLMSVAGVELKTCTAELLQCTDFDLLSEKVDCVKGLVGASSSCLAFVNGLTDSMKCSKEIASYCPWGGVREKLACLRRAVEYGDVFEPTCLDALKLDAPCSMERIKYCYDEESFGGITACLLGLFKVNVDMDDIDDLVDDAKSLLDMDDKDDDKDDKDDDDDDDDTNGLLSATCAAHLRANFALDITDVFDLDSKKFTVQAESTCPAGYVPCSDRSLDWDTITDDNPSDVALGATRVTVFFMTLVAAALALVAAL